MNELVRAAENARRFPMVCNLLVRDTSVSSWIGRRDIDFDLAADPVRKLVYEGRLDYIGYVTFVPCCDCGYCFVVEVIRSTRDTQTVCLDFHGQLSFFTI